MPIERSDGPAGVVVLTMDYPPVNALTGAGWFEVAAAVTAAGREPDVRAVVLAAAGRGYCAGVDIKELAEAADFRPLVAVNRGCFEAFRAVYECEVPVVAAVNGFCVGGGIGLVGNADIIVAADDAFFALPEVDRGALGAATHLSRLVPLQTMRHMVYTGARVTAAELHRFGSVLSVVPPDELQSAALAVATEIARRHPMILRRAKESLNGIDPVDVNRSYRFEQGFTYELNLSGVSDEARAAFVEKRDAAWES